MHWQGNWAIGHPIKSNFNFELAKEIVIQILALKNNQSFISINKSKYLQIPLEDIGQNHAYRLPE